MTPALHATMVGGAAVVALVIAGLILARNPISTPARVHAVYGGTAAWWLLSMALVASAESIERAYFWSRVAQAGIGMLPGVIYHVNVATSGLAHERRRAITVYYVLSAGVTVFCLVYPAVLRTPHSYSWGFYTAYSAWGAVPVGLMLIVFAEALRVYRQAMRRFAPHSPHYRRARTFYYGNHFAFLAVADFLPAFGVPIYPFGYVLIAGMYLATMWGAIRYRLIEITPEIAAARILATIPEGLLVADTQGVVRLANSAAVRLLGRRMEDLMNQPLASIVTDERLQRAFGSRGASSTTEEVAFTGADGTAYRVAIIGSRVHDQWQEELGQLWLLLDLTDQRRAEEAKARIEDRLRQTQKMESLGAMAGGIAHDFNNILMAIQGSAEVATIKAASGAPVDEELRTIGTAAEHAANLTDQLLTYAGRGTSIEAPVDLNVVLRDMTDLLRSAICKKATLDMDLVEPLPQILGDQGQVRQIILNLVTNASEALGGDAGRISVSTGVVQSADGSGDQTRPRVFLQVQDTGVGMSDETKARIFDPFFTTKFTGRGLGLPTVMGIVQKHGGSIDVESTPGTGTRFVVALPALSGAAASEKAARPAPLDWKSHGLALLVDDEAAVRLVVRKMLTDIGFDVVEATDGVEAVDVFARRRFEIAVVVLDMTMPGKDGKQAFAEIRALSPEAPVVFISGYTVVKGADSLGDARTAFLHKPFKLPALAARIREVMTGGPGAAYS